jgi:hypothetical protein
MKKALDDVCCASLLPATLPALAGLRAREGIRTLLSAGRQWMWWDPGDEEVLAAVLPLPGVELFGHRDEGWFRAGSRVPTGCVPSMDGAMPLSSALLPSPISPSLARRGSAPIQVSLVRDSFQRPASALLCSLRELALWADGATSRQLESLEAARYGDQVLVRGPKLPSIASGIRWWGARVFIPLGSRPEPELVESILCDAFGLSDGEMALLTEEGIELIPRSSFGPVSRAGVRLAARGE